MGLAIFRLSCYFISIEFSDITDWYWLIHRCGRFVPVWGLTFYRLPTKYREGNVFARVYLSTGGHVTITHDALDLTIQDLPPGPGSGSDPSRHGISRPTQLPQTCDLRTNPPHPHPHPRPALAPVPSKHGIPGRLLALPPVSDIWWPSMETCSNLFILGSPTSVHILWWSTYSLRKQAVRILLECFLVYFSIAGGKTFSWKKNLWWYQCLLNSNYM